ncbi:alpha/beta fold hydrolase [Pseudoclavibacter albus]|uniref:alpha/beta fold hydrolase n=1 Tax=Pseudoclavibacter albus TaxID=272241 RepID=UPI0037423A68
MRPSHSGSWCVFLHGAGCDGAMFLHQMGALPEDVGIVCWDARGHGASTLSGPFVYADMVDDLAAVLDEVCGGRAFLSGQSMGGSLAQTLAAHSPDRVERLVLIDCADNHAVLSVGDRLAMRWGAPLAFRLLPWRQLVTMSAEACALRSTNIAYAALCLHKTGRRRLEQVLTSLCDALEPNPDARFSIPTLAIVGEEDRTGRVREQLRALAERDPAVSLVEIPTPVTWPTWMRRTCAALRSRVLFEASHRHSGESQPSGECSSAFRS